MYDFLLYSTVIAFVVWLLFPSWTVFAWIVSRKPITRWLIRRAMRTPYTHLPGYMKRYWLLNAYESPSYHPWLPSVRIHHILRKDNDRHKHDHPWNARTVILDGFYDEEKVIAYNGPQEWTEHNRREPGDTNAIDFGKYHSISAVSEGGAWTMFITFRYMGTWGFLVDGVKVPWREYMAMHPEKPWAEEEHV